MIRGARWTTGILLITLPLFGGAALLFNFSKQKTRRSKSLPKGMCQGSDGLGCSCSSQVQTIIRAMDKEQNVYQE